jgi:mono/diheme cytochrome c family protein
VSGTRPRVLLGATILIAALSIGGCPIRPSTVLTGDAVAGQTLFADKCASCHLAASLKGNESRIVNNLGSGMDNIVLTDQQIADLDAFLAGQ